MAQDRGGLQYTIRVRDQFSRELQRFRDGVAEAKASFTSLQTTAGRRTGASRGVQDTTKAIDEQAAALRRLQAESQRQRAVERESVRLRSSLNRDAAREANRRVVEERRASAERARSLREEQRLLTAQVRAREQTSKRAAALEAARRRDEARSLQDEQRRLRGFVQAQQQRERVSARISQIQQRDLARARAAQPEVEAQRRVTRGLREEAVIRSQIAQLRARAGRQILGGDILGGRQTLRTAARLKQQLGDISTSGNSLLFTFRRLVGVLAIFTIAREAVAGFRALVTEGVAFNDRIESAVISVAGLVSAVTDVRDATGQSVDQTQELALATSIAREQVRLLRQDALRTTATFTQLLDTFQVAVAPGFSAGLDIDQIRKLTVAVSQAATAIGVPQNQLAEEIRSLLAGTIQARTTRIATALGITNADIRRLKETGELFNFLEERFGAFAKAAEQQARQTVAGIRTLVVGATQELLGQAAEPLFRELLDLGGQLFDRVLTIRDAAGNITPNPQALEAFRGLFAALALGVRRAREFGAALGFQGLKDVLDTLGAGLVVALEAAIGFAKGFFGVFSAVVGVVRSISREFNLTAEDLGKIAGTIASIAALVFVWKNTMGLVGVNATTVLGVLSRMPPVLLRSLGIILLIGVAFKALAEEILGVPLTFGEVGTLLKTTFVSAFETATVAIRLFAKNTANDLARILTDPIGFLASQASKVLGLIGGGAAALASVGLISEDQRAKLEDTIQGLEALANQRANKSKGLLFSEESLDADRRRLHEIEQETQAVFDRIAQGAGARAGGDVFGAGAAQGGPLGGAFAAAKAALDVFQQSLGSGLPILSTATSDVAKLDEALVKLADDLSKAGVEFSRAMEVGGLSGEAAQIERAFTEEQVANTERLRQLRSRLLETEGAIERITSQTGEERIKNEGLLKSLLQDHVILRNALNNFEEVSAKLATRRAAIIAAQVTPELQRENELLIAQARTERRVTEVVEARLGARRLAVVEAGNAVALAKQELQISQEALQQRIASVGARAQGAEGEERDIQLALLSSLQGRLELERAIAEEKIRQLEVARQEAALVESGTLEQGLAAGFRKLATEDLPTAFEAGINIARGSVQAFTDFVSSAIVDAFDPTDDTDIVERFARLLQQIAQLIIQQLIQIAIARALLNATTGGAGGAVGGGINPFLGIKEGGTVPRGRFAASPAHFSTKAKAFSRGGSPNARDIVPAWLEPGEFVLSKKGVRNAGGMGFLNAVNEGRFAIPAAPNASATHSVADGMQTGGQVSSEALRRASQGGGRDRSGGVVLPVLVANERQFDRLQAGGRNARLRFDRENAGTLRSIMQRGN